MISSQKKLKSVSFSLPNLMIRGIQSLRARQRLQEWPLLPHGDRFSTPFYPGKWQLGGYIPGNVFFHAFSMFFSEERTSNTSTGNPKKADLITKWMSSSWKICTEDFYLRLDCRLKMLGKRG